ncbi:MAG: hypothetical protein AVDCRST_MAG39-1978, partial [uncultured Sphingomonadaceae bacterium]
WKSAAAKPRRRTTHARMNSRGRRPGRRWSSA